MNTLNHALCRPALAVSVFATFLLVSFQQPAQTATVTPRPAPVRAAEALRLGSVEFPTSGAPAAQPHFLHGVAALHSFWYEEALEAFARAIAIDPTFAMARWGEAMCYHRKYRPGSDHEAGRKALAQIETVTHLTARERDYIAALRSLYRGDGTGDRAGYAAAMEKLHRSYPEDREAAAFYALALLGNIGRNNSVREKAGAIAEEVYRHNPNHPGAAHYIIHSYDAPEYASRALEAASHYSQIAPDAPHALHMPSHIFVQLGMWREAANSNDLGWTASVDYVRRNELTPTLRDYHNLHWLIYAALQQGRYAKAGERVDEFVRIRARNELASYSGRYIDSAFAAYLIETRRWDLAETFFGESNGAVTGVDGRELELCGAPLAATPDNRRRTGASSARNDTRTYLRAFAATMARGSPTGADGKRLAGSFSKARELQLTGAAHAHAGDFAASIRALREAAAIEAKTERPPGPPVDKPAHELLGEVLLRAGRPRDAVDAFNVALHRHPNRALALLGLARAEAASANPAAARNAYSRLLEIWKEADADLPELREARRYVASSMALASPQQTPFRD